jgi:hypothetical protein
MFSTNRLFITVFIFVFSFSAFSINKKSRLNFIVPDAGISAIVSPSTSGCYNATQSVVVTIQNFGNTIISNIPVIVIVSGPINQTISSAYVPNIPVGASVNFNVGLVDMSFGGIYTFSASTALPGDGNPNNDISITTRTVTPMVNITGPGVICSGGTATLITGGAANYTWSTGANTTSIIVSPTVTTTYSVTGTNTTGCMASAILTVSVQDPTINVTGAAGCGNPVSGTLAATAFSPAVISWYASPVSTIVLGTGNNYSVTAAATTTYYAEANSTIPGSLFTTLAGGNSSSGNMFDVTAVNTITLNGLQMHFNGLSTSTVEVWYRTGTFVGFENSNAGWTQAFSGTVNPLGTGSLTAVPGNFTIAIPSGQTYGIYVTTNGGSGVNYTNGSVLGNLFCSNTDLQLFEGKGGGYFSVTSSPRVFNGCVLYAKDGCSSPRVPVTFTVQNGVNVTAAVSNTAVCEGKSATITASGASNYTWSPAIGIAPGPFSAIIIASPTANTSYTLIGTVPGCTAVGTATANLTVISGPTLTISPSQTVIPGTILSLTTSGAFTYSWSPGGSNNTTILVNPSVTTVYTVTGANNFGCTSSVTTTVTIGSVGLNELSIIAEEINIWPNPVNDMITISFGSAFGNYFFELFDLTGQKVFKQVLNNKPDTQMNLKGLDNGVYFYRIISAGDKIQVKQGKLMKQ